jgi:hypothetical protein
MALAGSIAVQTSVLSEEYRGTLQQQMACTPDVWKLCFGEIPDVSRITACLRQKTPQLSDSCRAVFESNASMPPEQPLPAPAAKAPVVRTKPSAVSQ